MTDKILINCLKASTVVLSLLLFQPLSAQSGFTQLTRQLEEKSAVLGKDFVVLVGGKDSLHYRKEMGAMKAKEVAPIADASGLLTAALVLLFVDEGKLSLDDKVVQYLPVFEKYGKNYITMRHCLSHFTGIQNKGGKLARLFDRNPHATLDEAVAGFAAQEIETNPGTAFSYSPIGLHIAGRVLEVVGKKRFDLLIKQKLLTPLGMRQTTFTKLDGTAPDPFSGARSTALDYMAFLKMLLNGGKHNGQRFLSEAAIAQLRTVHTENLPMTDVPKGFAGSTYALGAWAVERTGNTATVLATPTLSGALPMVDFCRGYSVLFFPKEVRSNPKNELYGDLKKLTDLHFSNACQ